MQQRVLTLIAVSFLTATVYCYTPGTSEYDCYYDGKQYKFVISDAQQQRCPKWDSRTMANPPYPAAKALDQARQFIATIATKENTYWKFEHLDLVDVSGGWAWRAVYQLTPRGGGTGAWPTMNCWILMDGTVIKPILRKDEGNMD